MGKPQQKITKGRELIKASGIIFALIAALAILLAGCGKQKEDMSGLTDEMSKNISTTTAGQNAPLTNGQESGKGDIITATLSDPRQKMKTKLDEFSFDFDRDGKDEKIELYTQAERGQDGRIAWDDGQNWLLVIVDGSDFYPLFQDYIQIGSLYFGVWQKNSTPVICSVMVAGAGAELKNFVYDSAWKGYRIQDEFDTGGINLLHNSIPEY